jgi:hypothetical protein
MMPRLEAEESQVAATRVAVGSGSIDADTSKSIQASWERQTQRKRPKAQRATREELAARGIGRRVAPPPPKGTA